METFLDLAGLVSNLAANIRHAITIASIASAISRLPCLPALVSILIYG